MLDDVVADAELAERQLRKAGIPFALKLVETRETFLAALEDFSPDLILLDYELHQFDGWSALRLAQKRVPDVPVVMFTGSCRAGPRETEPTVSRISPTHLVHKAGTDWVPNLDRGL